MMKVIFIVIFFVTVFHDSLVAEKVICDSAKTISINENEIIFFESPGYPNEMAFETKKECKLQIKGNSTKINMRLIFVITKGFIQRGEIIESDATESLYNTYYRKTSFYHYTEKTAFIFFLGDPRPDAYDVFQGFITFEELKDDGCLLSNKTFEFTDETQILFLRSSYYTGLQYYINGNVNGQKCFWTFTAPDGYMFKLSDANVRDDSTVVVFSNQTRTIVKSGVQPYYFDASKISISSTNPKKPQNSDIQPFSAFLNVVSKVREISNSSCLFTPGEKLSVWEKQDEANKFDKVHCSISTSIKPKHQLVVNVTKFSTVEESNMLGYYIDNEGLNFQAVEKTESFMLEPNEDGSVRNVKWEYFSDEGLNGLAFRIEFQEIEYKCSSLPFIVPCSGNASYSLMDSNENYFYSARCNFTILPNQNCSNAHISMSIFMKFTSFNDNYNITVEDEIVKSTMDVSMELWTTPIHNILFKPNTTAIFHFLPASNGEFSSDVGYLKITLSSFYKTDEIEELVLSNENPMIIMELNKIQGNTAIIVKLSEDLKDEQMELSYGGSWIQSLLQCVTLFKDNSFTEVYKLDVNNFTVTIPSSIIIYKHPICDKEVSKLTFRAPTSQSFGCYFKKTILHLSKLKGTKFSMVSDSSGTCEIMLINLPGQYGFEKIWTNSNDENVSVLKNGLDNTTLISFNRTTASSWRNIKLNAVSYIITMPANVSILVDLFYPSNKVELQPASLSFYETPLYGTPNLKPLTDYSRYLLLRSSTFTVISMDISSKAVFQINTDTSVTDIKHINQSITITNTIAYINYSEPKIGYKGAIIHIKSFDHRYLRTTTLSNKSLSTTVFNDDDVSPPPENNDDKADENVSSAALMNSFIVVSLVLCVVNNMFSF